MVISCNKCENHNRDSARFCRYCGQPLDKPEDEPVSSEGETPAEQNIALEDALIQDLSPAVEDETFPAQPDPDINTLGTTDVMTVEVDINPNHAGVVTEETDTSPTISQDVTAPIEGNEGAGSMSDKPDLGEVLQLDQPENATVELTAIPDVVDFGQEDILHPVSMDDQLEDMDLLTATEKRISNAETVAGAPLAVDDLLAERYRITRLCSEQEHTFTYEAEDLLLCIHCEHLQSIIGDAYCENCGALFDPKPVVKITAIPSGQWKTASSEDVETLGEGPVLSGVEESVLSNAEGNFHYLIESQTTIPAEPPSAPILQIDVGYQSDAGELREIDEDSILVLSAHGMCESGGTEVLCFLAVADGIGGHEAGEIASRIAVRSLATSITKSVFLPEFENAELSREALKACLKESVLLANQSVYEARKKNEVDMGCTLTAALVRGHHAIVVNAGDSRTYHIRMGRLSQITTDHSVIAQMVAQNIIKSQEALYHEDKGVIYRSLGDKLDLPLDDSLFDVELMPGDRLLLCCDGLWEMVQDNFIEDVMLEYHAPQAACDRLVDMANLSGGDDNISVIVADVKALKNFH